MKIVLVQEYPRLGSKYDIVDVKRGYARNYLIPEGVAIMATKGNLKHAAEMKKYSAKNEERLIEQAEKNADKINELSLTIQKKAKADSDIIYGSVSVSDILEALKEKGITVHQSSILLSEKIKHLGVYDIAIKLHKSVEAQLKLWVVKEEEE
ncbi:MAG: 50S ribosomal protein L9 [Fibrobacterota bacterium]